MSISLSRAALPARLRELDEMLSTRARNTTLNWLTGPSPCRSECPSTKPYFHCQTSGSGRAYGGWIYYSNSRSETHRYSCSQRVAMRQFRRRYPAHRNGTACENALRALRQHEPKNRAALSAFLAAARAAGLKAHARSFNGVTLLDLGESFARAARPVPLKKLQALKLRYWSLVQLPATSAFGRGAIWGADARLLLMARTMPNRAAGHTATLLFSASADAKHGLAGLPSLWPVPLIRHATDVSHNFAATLGGAEEVIGVGGQFPPVGSVYMSLPAARNDGIYVFRARSLDAMLRSSSADGASSFFRHTASHPATTWGYSRHFGHFGQSALGRVLRLSPLPEWLRAPVPSTIALEGTHPGCAECRRHVDGACEFDGKLSVVRHRGRLLLYARANLARERGGRFVQVTSTVGDDAAGPWRAFAPLRIAGFTRHVSHNVYFAAVNANPLDRPDGTLIGLFPLALPEGSDARSPKAHCWPPWSLRVASDPTCYQSRQRVHDGVIGLSLSCDGLHWGPLVLVATCQSMHNRSFDQPVDGLIVVNRSVFVVVQRNVAGISSGTPESSERTLLPMALDATRLERLTRVAHETLAGCDADGATRTGRTTTGHASSAKAAKRL